MSITEANKYQCKNTLFACILSSSPKSLKADLRLKYHEIFPKDLDVFDRYSSKQSGSSQTLVIFSDMHETCNRLNEAVTREEP